jgi:hypothetical protein
LSLLQEWKQTPATEVRKILFIEKRRERLHSRECRGTRKRVVPWIRVGVGFYNLFLCVLPEGGDAFQMQMGVFWGRRSVSLTSLSLSITFCVGWALWIVSNN